MISYASAMEPLRAANVLSGRSLYKWLHFSPKGDPVPASNGILVTPDLGRGDKVHLDLLIVCAGGNPALFRDPDTLFWLRALDRRGVAIGGVSGGPYLLARAGLLDGYRCTIHWEHVPAFIEEFPNIDVTRTLYEIDRGRLTCSGGIAALDMMHELIARDHGEPLANAVSEWFLQTHVRLGSGSQRMSLRERLGVSSAKLLKVVERMEASIEEPASRENLARLAGVSVRQLERLFRGHLGETLTSYYRNLRLDRARALLMQTPLPLVEIAMACGFVDASHFGRAYTKRFGHPPSRERRRLGRAAPAP
jgi:transcriptional regulator GlxA family with amidase domain